MHVKKYLEKIIENGKTEDMIKLSEMLDKAIHKVKECDPEWFEKQCMKLYVMAYGEVLTEEMAEEWVHSMKPMAKWTMEETTSVLENYNVDLDKIKFYIVMNMLYSDMKNVLGEGNDEESIKKYIQASKDWLNDEDVSESKLFKYYRYIVQK